MGVDSLHRAIDEAREEFRAALDVDAAVWNRPPAGVAGDAWTPRQVAEHVLGAELGYAGAVASALGLPRPAWQVFTLASAVDARTELDAVAAVSRTVLSHVRDEDLQRRVPSGATVREVMAKATNHLREHAEQLRAMTAQAAP